MGGAVQLGVEQVVEAAVFQKRTISTEPLHVPSPLDAALVDHRIYRFEALLDVQPFGLVVATKLRSTS